MVTRIDRLGSGNRGALAGDVLCLATNCFYLRDRFWDRPLKCFSDGPEPIRRSPLGQPGVRQIPFGTIGISAGLSAGDYSSPRLPGQHLTFG